MVFPRVWLITTGTRSLREVGFAYDVYGNGKTILRGGFGVFYERNGGNEEYNMGANVPFSNSGSTIYPYLDTTTTTWTNRDERRPVTHHAARHHWDTEEVSDYRGVPVQPGTSATGAEQYGVHPGLCGQRF